jgi:hypothetical protein
VQQRFIAAHCRSILARTGLSLLVITGMLHLEAYAVRRYRARRYMAEEHIRNHCCCCCSWRFCRDSMPAIDLQKQLCTCYSGMPSHQNCSNCPHQSSEVASVVTHTAQHTCVLQHNCFSYYIELTSDSRTQYR